MQGRAGSLHWETFEEEGQATVALSGDLDLPVCHALRDVFDALGDAKKLSVDLAELRYVDSTGLHCLLNARTRVLAGGGEFAIRSPSPPVLRAIQVAGLEGMFHTDSTPGTPA